MDELWPDEPAIRGSLVPTAAGLGMLGSILSGLPLWWGFVALAALAFAVGLILEAAEADR